MNRNRKPRHPHTSTFDREEAIFFGTFGVIFIAATIAVVKLAQIDAQNVKDLRDAGATVIDTPLGRLIIN